MESRHYYRSLARNMLLTVIGVSLAPLILAVAIIGYRFETSYRDKVLAHLAELVEKHQQNIDSFLDDKLSHLRILALSHSFEQLSSEAFLRHELSVLQSAYTGVFVDTGLVDDQGIQIAYAGAFQLEKADYSQSAWFRKAIARPFFISDVFLGLRNQPHFIVAARRNWGGREYVLRATIDFEAFNSLVEGISIGRTGHAFITNNEGRLQTRRLTAPVPDEEFFAGVLSKKHDASYHHETPGQPPGALSGSLPSNSANSNISIGMLHHGDRNIIYVMTPLKSDEWVLAYQQEETDAFSDLYLARKLAILITLLGGIAIVGMALAVSKITVRRIEKADREKELMNERVIEAGKLASVGELAAGVAHEINNPVAIIIEEAGWMSDLIEEEDLRESPNLAEFKESLNQIQAQGERCREISCKLLSFARGSEPSTRKVQINELIEEIVAISEQRSRFDNIKITTHLASELPDIQVSPTEIQQVLINLLNNAVDAIGPDGGTIDIKTRIEGDMLAIDVTDTGHGISREAVKRVFDPFFTTKPVGKGTGLGLSICYGILKKMGGDISLSSAVGAGTTFHIQLPLADDERETRS